MSPGCGASDSITDSLSLIKESSSPSSLSLMAMELLVLLWQYMLDQKFTKTGVMFFSPYISHKKIRLQSMALILFFGWTLA